jgi:acyl dehydratase
MNRPNPFAAPDIYWDDLTLGDVWHTQARTITEPDLVAWLNLTWLTEELFTNLHDHTDTVIEGRLVPGAMVFSMSEALTLGAIRIKGLAFLHSDLTVKGPTRVGDTLHVRSTVIELRPATKTDRALARTRNETINQRGETVLDYTALRLMRRRG